MKGTEKDLKRIKKRPHLTKTNKCKPESRSLSPENQKIKKDKIYKKSILNEISQALLDRKKVIFLFGAGSSIASGMPGSETLKNALWEKKLSITFRSEKQKVIDSFRNTLEIDIKGKKITEIPKDITFEELMAVAYDLENGSAKQKEESVAEWLEMQIPDIYTGEFKFFPSVDYEFVCHLMSNGLVKYIINMNYDEILDKAIDDELGKGRCFKAVTLEDFEFLHNNEDWEKATHCDNFLIKPHGTRGFRRSCRYRKEFIKRFESDKREVLKKVYTDSILILIGFEAVDPDFQELLAYLSLDKFQKIIVVKNHPERVLEKFNGKNTKIWGFKARGVEFFKSLSDTLYSKNSNFKEKYNKYYTKATRHFIRFLIYQQVNPISDDRKNSQKESKNTNPLFFEKLNLLIEILIYCFKVRGLFTRRALSTCPRITSALNDYLEKAQVQKKTITNPIEDLLSELENSAILTRKDLNIFESWYYIPAMDCLSGEQNNITPQLFKKASEKAVVLLEKLLSNFNKKINHKEEIIDYFARLPNDFDYDLSKDLSLFFSTLKNISLIIRRETFRENTQKILKKAKEFGIIYIISPSVCEWFINWGLQIAGLSKENAKIIVNQDVCEIKDSLHYMHISHILKELDEKTKLQYVPGIKYGMTLTYKESGVQISGLAILFPREGKASAYCPIFLEEIDKNKKQSDIDKLKTFFEEMFNNAAKKEDRFK